MYCNLGLEEQLGSQKESYDQKLTDLENKLAEATAGDKIAKKEDLDKLTADFEEKVKNAADDSTQRYTLLIHMALDHQKIITKYLMRKKVNNVLIFSERQSLSQTLKP